VTHFIQPPAVLQYSLRGIIDTVIAFYLPGGVPVYISSIFLGMGATLALLWIGWQSPDKVALQAVNSALIALLGCLLLGRAAHVAAHWSYYQENLWKIPQFHLGGIAWPGALAGGVLVIGLYAAVTHQPLGRLLNSLIPLAGMLALSAWLACWLDGCFYGQVIDTWWALPAPNEWGAHARRVPVQLLGALLSLGTLWLAERFHRRLPAPGLVALLFLLALSLQLLALSFLRADPVPTWQGLHLDTWAALGLAGITSLVFLTWFIRARYRRFKEQ
jgi:phosphatidylglycerol:prolipoprotein diacylglycerol transferase